MLGHFPLSELLSLLFVIYKYCVIQTQTLNIIQTTMGKWNQIACKMLHGKKHNVLFCCPSCWLNQLCISIFFCFYLIIMIKADLFTRMVKLLLINVEFQWNYHSFPNPFLKCQNSFPNKPPEICIHESDSKRNQLTWHLCIRFWNWHHLFNVSSCWANQLWAFMTEANVYIQYFAIVKK